ncbi:MAG TPA: proton-conducting transporter membrane subunit, partial [Bryobacteraceae bacterium]|nr:proton-conducting transporter membrane subunit [Bryobacteraceae bacterium]
MGALAGLALYRRDAWAGRICFPLAVLAALLQGVAAVTSLWGGDFPAWVLPSAIPYLSFTLRLDPLSAFFNLTLSIVGLTISLYSIGYVHRNTGVQASFYHLALLSLSVVFTAGDLFFFLVAWEIMALAGWCLISYGHRHEPTRDAGLLFFILSHAGTGCVLLGFLLLFQTSGSFDFLSLHLLGGQLSPARHNAAFLLFLIGFGVKAGIVPLHIWLPAAHPVAPSNASALLSGILLKAGIYGLVRVLFDFLGAPPVWWGSLVLTVGVISALFGILSALVEHDLKRLLAYSSIENIGIILIAIGAALLFQSLGHGTLAALALIAGLFHTLNHAIFKSLLFLGAGAVLSATGTREMDQMGGLIRRMPRTALFFLIGALAICGFPPLNGFIGEWLTYQALLGGFGSTGGLTRVIFPIAGSLLALTAALAAACFVKAFGISFLARPRGSGAESAREVGLPMLAGMGLLAAACVLLGLGSGWFLPMFDPITAQ